jgi:hypothetical protein
LQYAKNSDLLKSYVRRGRMKLYGHFYENETKKEMYLSKRRGLYYLTDGKNMYKWFVNEQPILNYCEKNLDKFEMQY